ncbi:adrenodoxin isoform X1 [Octopus bimaculoides]|uniref:2Fe-2S ferredoxin-type domain-containing protein n=2 Tax=Octopus TaxID=6643 RepID=A0A0L8HUP5_OCTBM|nr:adrenodoxin isoform X1 [Octopus bimaculoides]XP_029657279.1 adrenodoxin isoform X1 [Octopus sinensis]|eukprot:XP_014769560.1 PREDICTED: adrenodoxin-like isoform X1 [Octopus bimaculoides]
MSRFVAVAFRSACRLLNTSRPLTSKRDTQYTSVRNFLVTQSKTKDKVTIYFVTSDGNKIATEAKVNSTLLDSIIDNDLDFDGFGACEGTMACSTCHVILPKHIYNAELPSDEEQDLLDMAYGLTDTSRLGCQVYVTEDMDGVEIKIPTETNDIRGFS